MNDDNKTLKIENNENAEKKDSKSLAARTVLLVCVVSLLISAVGLAYMGVKKLGLMGISWSLTDEGVLTITGKGEMEDFNAKEKKDWRKITEIKIKDVIISEGITSIGDYAFYKCTSIEKVTLPKSLKEIGQFAFSGCNYIKEIAVPAKVTTIGEGAFYGCGALGDIKLSDGIKSIGYDAFYGTGYYRNEGNWSSSGLYLEDCFVKASDSASGAITVAEGTLYVADGAFENCVDVTGVSLPDSLVAIGANAFAGCSGMFSISLPKGLKYVGDSAFYNCDKLNSLYYEGGLADWLGIQFVSEQSNPLMYVADAKIPGMTGDVVVPEGVTVISPYAFAKRTDITSISLPTSLTEIGDDAFYGCSALTAFTVAEGNKGFKAVDGVLYTADGEKLLCYPAAKNATSYTLPDGVKTIGPRAFAYNTTLSEIKLNDGFTAIEDKAFIKCAALKSLTLPNTVESIGKEAFADCTAIAALVLPDGLKTMDKTSFAGCTALKKLTLAGDFAGMSGDILSAFSGVTELTLGEKLTGLDTMALLYIEDIQSLTVEEGNPDFKVSTDAVLNGDGTGLLFYYGKGISYTIPQGVKYIGVSAFEDAQSLEKVTLPQSLTEIRDGAFNGCAALKEINLDNITKVSAIAFEGCEGIKEQIDALFDRVKPYTAAAFTAPVSEDETQTKDGLILSADGKMVIAYTPADGQTACTVPDGVVSIGEGVFSGATNLKAVTLPEGLVELGYRAFYGCTGIESIKLPTTLSAIGDEAFSGCTALTAIEYPESYGHKEICSLYSKYFVESKHRSKGALYLGSYLLAVDKNAVGILSVKDGTTCIADMAFYNCKRLTSADIPESVKHMGKDVFLSSGIKGLS